MPNGKTQPPKKRRITSEKPMGRKPAAKAGSDNKEGKRKCVVLPDEFVEDVKEW